MPNIPFSITRAINSARRLGWLLVLLVPLPALADVNTSLSLLQAVKTQEEPAFAPMSVLDMLGLLYYGSSGKTEQQMGALFAGQTRETVAKEAAKAQRALPGYRRIDSVWFSERVQVTNEFFQAASDQWKYNVSAIPLRTDPAKAASLVNFWYSEQTNGYIKSVVSPADLDGKPDMLAVLVTVFISPWKGDYFSNATTSPMMFYRSSDEKFLVRMMKTKERFPYYEDEQFQVLTIPYKSDDFTLLVFLPKDARQFDQALGALNGKYLLQAASKAKPELINLQLPRVDYDTEISWRDIFLKSKLSEPFTPGKANFSGINENHPEPLFIAKLIEKVEIKWNEKGTEARSTVTASTDPFGPAPEKPKSPKSIDFNANHPFCFVIYNEKARDAAFAGIITAPGQMEIVQ
ncbi:serpin family protein [Cerasicoccus arenae]|uniref:Serpin domain-containing protein n=1 Tax=Cerasicoccus arenae TaxID=424488 RepID=A0A8J3D8Z7_9BACT|nr:serpin family protein [Cerasicoccus arenae]MBK1858172.1 serpin family protein [Cerasicoccus arenae]GHB96942.1 hypothetical protein GCM10007047_11140 [Cerasicoccus arenae]